MPTKPPVPIPDPPRPEDYETLPAGPPRPPRSLASFHPDEATANAISQMNEAGKDVVWLRSTKDPSVIIKLKAGNPFDPREWSPLNQPSASPAAAPAPWWQRAITGNIPPAGANPAVDAAMANLRPTAFHEAADIAKAGITETPKAILPMAGAAVGSVAGPPGMVLGGMVGEGANQLLGITEPDSTTVLLNGVLPGVGHALGRVTNSITSAIGKRLPGASSTLHEMAAEQLGKIPGAIQPTATADSLYKIVDGFAPQIDMPNLRAAAAKLLSKEEQAAAGLKLPSVSATAESLATAAESGMPFQDVRVNLRRLGDKVRETRAAGGEEHGANKELWKAAMSDLEAAAANGDPAQPAVQALKAANGAFKREMAAADLGDLFSIKGGGLSPRPGANDVQVNFGTILKKLEKNPDLKRTLGADEYDKLVTDVREMWARTPNLPSVPGQDAGSKLRNKSISIGAGVGGALGTAYGNTALGLGIGAAAGGMAPDILGKLMVSEGGRRFLHGVLTGTGGVLNPETMSILAVAVGNTPPARDTAVKLGDMGRQYLTTGSQ